MTNANTVSSRFPYLPIRVNVDGTTYEGDALLDTGFSGGIMLPSRYLPDNALLSGYIDWVLADHSTVRAPFYRCTVEINGFRPFRSTATIMGDEVLVGIRVISQFYVLLDHGERVVVSQ